MRRYAVQHLVSLMVKPAALTWYLLEVGQSLLIVPEDGAGYLVATSEWLHRFANTAQVFSPLLDKQGWLAEQSPIPFSIGGSQRVTRLPFQDLLSALCRMEKNSGGIIAYRSADQLVIKDKRRYQRSMLG